MKDSMAEIDCLNCDKLMVTGYLKNEGDIIECPHCQHKHEVDIDDDESGNTFWFARNLAVQVKEG